MGRERRTVSPVSVDLRVVGKKGGGMRKWSVGGGGGVVWSVGGVGGGGERGTNVV